MKPETIETLVVTVTEPAQAYTSDKEECLPIIVNGVTTRKPMGVPWRACADILINSATREFVGLRWNVPEYYSSLIAKVVEKQCSTVVTHMSNDYFDLLWGSGEADGHLTAQLLSDNWYYYGDPLDDDWYHSAPVEAEKLIAIGVTDMKYLLESYSLVMPHNFRVPVLPFSELYE